MAQETVVTVWGAVNAASVLTPNFTESPCFTLGDCAKPSRYPRCLAMVGSGGVVTLDSVYSLFTSAFRVHSKKEFNMIPSKKVAREEVKYFIVPPIGHLRKSICFTARRVPARRE